MVFGYARVSTNYQAKDGNSLDAQVQTLKAAGAEKIYTDAFTGTKTDRPEMGKLLLKLQPGDKLIVTKLDRIARSATQGFDLIESLLDKGVDVHVLNMGLMDNTPTGRLIRHIMLAFAEFERDMIVERTQEGKVIARQKKGYREGRPKKYGREQIRHALELMESYPVSRVSEMMNISRSTLMRAKQHKKEEEIVPVKSNKSMES